MLNAFVTFSIAKPCEIIVLMQTSILLLTDVFDNCCGTRISFSQIDPDIFDTAVSSSWSAMLLKTGVELELISDLEVPVIVERSKPGGSFAGCKQTINT